MLAPYHPDSSAINHKKHLTIGGYDLIELAERFGTPLYVIDEITLRNNICAYTDALSQHYPHSQVIFACKALCLSAILKIMADEGLGMDVVSAGELHTASSIGVPNEKIYFHGNNKSPEEIQMLVQADATPVIDNFREIELLASEAAKQNKKVHALLRITPGVECHTHEYIKTGHLDSKFGFDLEQLPEALSKIQQANNIELKGLHLHIGSQIFETQPFLDALKIVLAEYKKIKETYGWDLSELNLGGGFGIHYTEDDDPPTVEPIIAQIASILKQTCQEYGLQEPKLILEPGRSLVGRAGITLYSIGSRKDIPALHKSYIAVDGGMADNPRPITYQAEYRAALVRDLQSNSGQMQAFTLAGKYCESGDVLIPELQLPQDVQAADILVIFGTGAYNYSMSSNYNRAPRPAMVLLPGDGNAEVILRRESLEDLLAHDVLPPRLG